MRVIRLGRQKWQQSNDGKQAAMAAWHLASDAGMGVTGKIGAAWLSEAAVWRRQQRKTAKQ